jgi:uncharacterized protein (TIGR02266 family)
MAAEDDEKRREAREPITLFVEYEGADDLVGDFTENLSSGGTFVATNRELPLGQRVQLVLSFPGLLEPISIEGYVRWHRADGEDGGDAGAGSSSPPGAAREQLQAIVERVKLRDPKTVSRTFRVLVVEDNRHVAALIQEGLRGSSRRDFNSNIAFMFRNAEDGRAAVEILRREQFDALIIDVYLPILDGAEGDLDGAHRARARRAPDHRGVRRWRCRAPLRARGRREHLPRQADAAPPGARHHPAPAPLTTAVAS